MADYCVETCRRLAAAYASLGLLRPMRVWRYEPGDRLAYSVTGVFPAREAQVALTVETFVGGGFAGQVYRVRVESVTGGPIDALAPGGTYALKILIPPSPAAKWFRDALYCIGFGGAFSLQVNPVAARAGALWQKFIRRAAAQRFGRDDAVVDILATLVDDSLGSCGELSEWVEGRQWQFEVNDRIDLLSRWRAGKLSDPQAAGSAEYRAKRVFMGELVTLFHEMGAAELARQYEWSTCKSQPNVLKRLSADDDPSAGLTAVDFRAGLALLPMLPMSPGDFRLIGRGIARGSLVQFDRGDVEKLRAYISAQPEQFADMDDALEELVAAEQAYRDSLIDVTHHHVRLAYSRRIWSSVLSAAVAGWRVSNDVDDRTHAALAARPGRTLAFAMLGAGGPLMALGAVMAVCGIFSHGWLGPAAAALVVGAGCIVTRRVWGRGDTHGHYARMLGDWKYLLRALCGRRAETLVKWLRGGRVSDESALTLMDRPLRFAGHLPLSVLPVFLHRMLTDRSYASEWMTFVFVRPVRLYFNTEAREAWLREMLAQGRRRRTLTDHDAEKIESQISEPYIQKYLKSLAVHVCTLPITQVVSVAVAAWYLLSNPDLPWEKAWGMALFILAAFQVVPVSPGSLARGLYVVYMAVKDRSFRDYNIAISLGFLKYVGYLAFPIQMTYRYPALARFMAGHWATGAVRAVPVFGEHGALLEHGAFDLFYNRPLTLRRRMAARARQRATQTGREWHTLVWLAVCAAGAMGLDFLWLHWLGHYPRLRHIWLPAGCLGMLLGAAAAGSAGRMTVLRRIGMAALAGIALGVAYEYGHGYLLGRLADVTGVLLAATRRAFFFGVTAVIGAVIEELTVFDDTPVPPPGDDRRS